MENKTPNAKEVSVDVENLIEKIRFEIKQTVTADTDNWGHYGGLNDESIIEAATDIAKLFETQTPTTQVGIDEDELDLRNYFIVSKVDINDIEIEATAKRNNHKFPQEAYIEADACLDIINFIKENSISSPIRKPAINEDDLKQLAIDLIPIYPIRDDAKTWEHKVEVMRNAFISGYKAAQPKRFSLKDIEDAFNAAHEKLETPRMIDKIGNATKWSWMKYNDASEYISTLNL